MVLSLNKFLNGGIVVRLLRLFVVSDWEKAVAESKRNNTMSLIYQNYLKLRCDEKDKFEVEVEDTLFASSSQLAVR